MRRVVRTAAVIILVLGVIGGSYQIGSLSRTAKAGPSNPPPAAAPTITDNQPSVPVAPAAGHTQEDAQQRFQKFWEAWNLVEKEFYSHDAIDYDKMTSGAIRGALESLGDPNTTYADPNHAKLSEEDMRGSFDGIGVTVEMKDRRLTIVSPVDDSPGEKAGLRPGDVIVKVDERDLTDVGILDAISLIRGPRGTTVQLAVERAGEPAPLVFRIVRAEIKTVTVKGEMKDGQVAYIRLTQFAEPSGVLLQQKLKELMTNSPKAVILDLRNNPGGLLTSAVDVVSQFIADGVVMYEEQRDAPLEALYARRGGIATVMPIVVLVNKGSASASEIVAGALQDRARGVLVGEATFGKDTVQNVHQLSDQSSVRITVARWLTPNKRQIGEKGLTPDVEVKMTDDDLKAGRDPQLERAIAVAQGQR